VAPAGYTLVKIVPPVVHDDRWRDANAWNQLQTGMTAEQVEALLGTDHTTTTRKDGRTFWGYGLLAGEPVGRVFFADGGVSTWRHPDF
jgi:hypothetical protein